MRSTLVRASLGVASLSFAVASIHCSSEPTADPGEARGDLAAAFPEQASLVLDGPAALTAQGGRFALAADAKDRARDDLRLTLPGRGDEPIELRGEGPRGGGAFTFAVREIGAKGEGKLAGGAVAYARAGGTSYWRALPRGYEEWLLLDAGVATADRAAASWEIEGGTPREEHGRIVIADETGIDRVTVAAPVAYAADSGPVALRLSASGRRIDLFADARGQRALIDPIWIATGAFASRQGHTATLLASGKVFVAGGGNAGHAADLYSPLTNTWSPAAPASFDHEDAAAALLPDGKVFIAGDLGSDGQRAEVYDPITNTWTSAPLMPTSRYDCTATLLPGGKVLVAGGSTFGTDKVDLYDPIANTWAPAASMTTFRAAHRATSLPDGRVLVTGGYRAGNNVAKESSSEIYDPVTNTWSAGPSMGSPRRDHTATSLANGKVLVTGGGSSQGVFRTTEIYNPATNTWSSAGLMAAFRTQHAAALLPSGKVLVAGGFEVVNPQATVEIYDPAANTWKAAPSMLATHAANTATALQNGKVLVVGPSAELYTSGANGIPCAAASDCESGFCVDGVCCATACNTGPCDACAVAAGAAVDGVCEPLTGPACNDGNACTQTDTCQAGACVGASPVVCPPAGPCQEPGACKPATGLCSAPTPSADGTPCDDGDACTKTDACLAGACAGQSPVTCKAKDACHKAGACDPATGVCSDPAKPDGSACNDGNACTQSDTCKDGVCQGASPVVCEAPDACHKAGTCNPATGACSSPKQPNGTPCDDGNACTKTDTCVSGACTGKDPVSCAPLDECHEAGSCDEGTGMCSDPAKADGAPCTGGTCQAGACKLDGGAGGGSTTGTSTTSTGTAGSGGSDGSDGSETCGCRVVGGGGGEAGWAGAIGMAIAALVRRRRRAPGERTGC